MQIQVSPEINHIVDEAAAFSSRQGRFYVGVDHLFTAIINKADLLPSPIADAYLKDLHKASQSMQREAWQGTLQIPAGEVFHTPRCAALLNDTVKLAERMHSSKASVGHLLLSILADAHAAPSRAMDSLEGPRGELIKRLRAELTQPEASPSAAPAQHGAAKPHEDPQAAPSEPKSQPFSLASVSTDLTKAAAEGKLSAAIGRDEETFQVLQVLARQGKSNVMLVGEAGVGKTKIIESLALSMAQGTVDSLLKGCRLLELNVGLLVSGTQYRGAFEEKLLGIIEELKRSKDIILFIDEVHLIMGAGSTEGDGMDAANLLKPALARGEIRCIGATTLDEYRKFIEKDPAIERRFQLVRVEPLSRDATRQVLEAMRPVLQRHHHVRISGRALDAAVDLSDRHMPNRQLPDKAIDVIDQACARFRLKISSARDKGDSLSDTITPTKNSKVTPHDVRKIVSQITSLPIEQMTADERVRLMDLERVIKKRIIGQDSAVAKVVAMIKKSRVGLADPDRPDAAMLFLGPTGVGKTQLAKELARSVFGSSQHLITFDMSSYTEAHSVSRLLGAPPGYVGSEEEGLLTGAVRKAPFSILLFDEIEKADPKIFDVFLPILDEGRLKDSRGKIVSFKNCIIIFTSNIGANNLYRSETGEDQSKLIDELRKHFRPEFINRIDDIVPFYPLLFEDIRSILRILINQLRGRLKDRKIGVRMYQRAYEYLAEHGYNNEFGARELMRTVEKLVVNPISDLILKDTFKPGDMIDVLMDDEGNLSFRPGQPKKQNKEVKQT